MKRTDKLLGMGPKLIAVTLGSEGVLMATKEKKECIAGFSVQSVDRPVPVTLSGAVH